MPPSPVKISHRKDGYQRRPNRFRISRPSPNWQLDPLLMLHRTTIRSLWKLGHHFHFDFGLDLFTKLLDINGIRQSASQGFPIFFTFRIAWFGSLKFYKLTISKVVNILRQTDFFSNILNASPHLPIKNMVRKFLLMWIRIKTIDCGNSNPVTFHLPTETQCRNSINTCRLLMFKFQFYSYIMFSTRG